MARWLVKSEPFKYSWEQLNKDGQTAWDGVRNNQAAIYLRSMKIGAKQKKYVPKTACSQCFTHMVSNFHAKIA